MEKISAQKRLQAEDFSDCPAKRPRIVPDFELSKTVPKGFLRTYKYTPDLCGGVTAVFNFSLEQIRTLMEEELDKHQYKVCLVFHVQLMKNNPSDTTKTEEAYFRSNVITILSAHAIDEAVQKAFAEIERRIEKWPNEGSGWVITKVLNVYLDIAKYTPLKGSSFPELPKYLKSKKAIINVKNNDQQCLKWTLLSALHPVEHGSHPDRLLKYIAHDNKLNFTGIDFPTPLSQIPEVEHLNNLSINVFGYSESARVHPLYLTKNHSTSPINLLLITKVEDGKTQRHFCWIKDFNKLCFDQTKHINRKFFCLRCISPHSSERTLEEHLIYCKGVDAPPCHAVFPEKSADGSPPTIKFEKILHMMNAPYVINADTESIIKPTDNPNTDTNTIQTSEHIPCSFAYAVVRSDGKVVSEQLYRGEDCMDVFFDYLDGDLQSIREDLKNERTLDNNTVPWDQHNAADRCWICGGAFQSYSRGDKGECGRC